MPKKSFPNLWNSQIEHPYFLPFHQKWFISTITTQFARQETCTNCNAISNGIRQRSIEKAMAMEKSTEVMHIELYELLFLWVWDVAPSKISIIITMLQFIVIGRRQKSMPQQVASGKGQNLRKALQQTLVPP